MKKKVNPTHKGINRLKFPEPQPINSNIMIYTDLSSIIQKFHDSFSKYIQSLRNYLNELNLNFENSKSNIIDTSSNKSISSLSIICNYLDSSFNQFYTNITKYLEQININTFSKISNSSKKPNMPKNFLTSNFYNDNNYKKNSIYDNYHNSKVEHKKLYKNNGMSKMNTTTELNYNSSIEEKFGTHNAGINLKNNTSNNLVEETLDQKLIEKVKNLLNILKYEKISDLGSGKKSQYQQKLDNYKEKLISEISNEINDKTEKEMNPMHRRIRSLNLNSKSFSFIESINEENDNQINELNKEKNKNDYKESLYHFKSNNNLKNILVDNDEADNNSKIINKTKLENDKLKNENDILEKNKKELHIQIADLITKNNSLTEEISILKNTNLKQTEIRNEMEKINQELKKNIDICQNEKNVQLKEIKKLTDSLEDLKKENKGLNNKISENKKTIKDLKIEIDDLNKGLSEFVKENEKLNNELEEKNTRKEEYKEKYKKTLKELSDEKEMNILMEQKVKKLEKKLEEHNINEYDDEKTKTYKISSINKVNEIEVEKLPRKYVSPYNYRKNTSAFSTNNTSNNNRKILINNIDDCEITPDNYVIVKHFQLNNNLKWYLLKKIKKRTEPDPSPTPSPNQSNSKPLYRRFKYLKLNSREKNEVSFSDFVWKPNRNERDFINFNFANNDNIDINKNEISIEKDKQKKINELECIIKDLEEKLEKKENDYNRINLNFAKLFKRSKQPELNYDKLLENNEKLKNENNNLKKKIENLKATQNFIGLSFIEDDLEGSRFIDDKCFEDILDGLVGNSRKTSTYKRNRNDQLEINMLKFFRSHGDDNDNKDINEENNNNDNNNINNKEDLNEVNNADNKKAVGKEKKIHLFYKDELNKKFNTKNENNNNNNNSLKDCNKLNTFKNLNEKKNLNENSNENANNNNIKYGFSRHKLVDIKSKEKNDNLRDNSRNEKNNENEKDLKKSDSRKLLSYRYSRLKKQSNKNDNNCLSEQNNKIQNKNENIEKSKDKDKIEIKTILMKKNYFKNESNKNESKKVKDKNEEPKNIEKKIFINKITDNMINKKVESEPTNKDNIYTNNRRLRNPYRRFQNVNNETDYNNNINFNNNEDKKKINNIKKDDNKDNKAYRSLKTMKLESEVKYGRGLKESSSQTNRVCRGRRFYKRKQEDIQTEINE